MAKMRYRRFGRTELQMPVFSCGGMRYQQGWKDLAPDEIDKANQANLEATIHRSLEVGINHIETARGYGSSEQQLGWVLPKIDRDKLIVQTKVAPSEDPKQFLETFNKSMKLLQLDYVDLLGLHGVNDRQTLDWSVRKGGCLEVAEQLIKEGRVRHVGFSTHGSTDVIVDGINDGRFSYVNLHWYYIFQRNWPAIEAATKQDMGVFIISPSDKGGKLYAPPQKLTDLCAPLPPIIFNDLFCLQQSKVHTLSVGAARPTDFDLHVQSLDYFDRADEVLKPIIAKLSAAMKEAVGVSHPEDMSAGLPEHDATPGGMNLPIMIWLRNLTLGWDMGDYAKMRYNLLGNGGHWFPGQNASKLEEVDEAKVLAVAGKSPAGKRVVELIREAHDLLGGAEVKRLSAS
jgi:predicted aldo/keto reductase-like oxidoreductase